MIKKQIKYLLFTVFLCIVLTGCRNTEEITVNSIQTETNNVEREESSEISSQISESIQEEFNDYIGQQLEMFSFYQECTDTNKKEKFIQFLFGKVTPKNTKALQQADDFYQSLYEMTGESIFVLWDEYNGLLENDEIAKNNHIYKKPNTGKNTKISFAGDLCLTEDGFVIDHYDEIGQQLNQCISQEIIDETTQANLFILNHEYPVSNRGVPLEGKYYTFRADPKREQILNELGTDLVSLSNNHIYDYGADAFYDTLDILNEIGIPYMGAGKDMNEASSPVYYIVNGIKIGFLAANRSEKIIYTPEATENSPGVVRMYDTQKMNEMITKTSKECDYLITYLHWGTEDSPYYEQYQTDIAKEFFASGADAIIGGHPHVLQGMEYIDGKPVIYSLGDFWFNSETKYTTIVSLELNSNQLQKVQLLPCIQENFETHIINDPDKISNFYSYIQELSPNAIINNDGTVLEKK